MRRFIAFFVFAAFVFAAVPLFASPPSKKPQNSEPSVLRVTPLPKTPAVKKPVAPSAHTKLVRTLSKILDKDSVQKIFSNPRLRLDRSVVAKGSGEFVPSTLLTPESIERGKGFIRRNEWLIGEAERRWKVDREVIAAIMRVETNFGKNLGSRSVLNTLYSIYILNPKKRDFAFKELVAFLDLAERYSWDHFDVKGSISGAIGIPQFIPTSYNLFAVDANNDGRADLFDEADAINSVAYYLAIHGWGERFDQKRKAVFAYNHSWGYVDDVLSYAWALKKPTPVQYWREEEKEKQEKAVP